MSRGCISRSLILDPSLLVLPTNDELWQIMYFDNKVSPEASIYASDGQSINKLRGGKGNSSRFIVTENGFIDITDLNDSNALDINGQHYTYTRGYTAKLTITLLAMKGTFTVTGGDNKLVAQFKPLPSISKEDLGLFNKMMDIKLVPYQNIPDAPGKTNQELEKLGKQFFPFAPYNFELAMSVYDWTTASFFRIFLLKHFVYTDVSEAPLDMPTIVQMIWESNWGTYVPENHDFMNSLLMKPATSLEDVSTQLHEVASRLRLFVDAQSQLISCGLNALPRSSTQAIPKLYSGQVDVYQYNTTRFLPLFMEFPGNEGPASIPLQMSLEEGLDTQLKDGNILTSKAFISFTTTEEDALQYANGIILILNPPTGTLTWPQGAYVTPLSNNPAKVEYVMPPLTRFSITNKTWKDEMPCLFITLSLIE